MLLYFQLRFFNSNILLAIFFCEIFSITLGVDRSKLSNKNTLTTTTTTTKATTVTTSRAKHLSDNNDLFFHEILTTTTTTTIPTINETSTPLLSSLISKKIEVIAYCKDPGRPPKSQISPVQLTYVEDEQVQYTCDEFISLKQYRKCLKGKWYGEMPLCGNAFRQNDVVQVFIYEAENGFPKRLLNEYNLTNNLKPFNKFGNSFIAERYSNPVRAKGAKDYYWNIILEKPALIQMIRISFSIVNHLIDPKMRTNVFEIVTVVTNQYRDCQRVSNNSVSPWHYNSTRFDYWYFCRAKSLDDFYKEIEQMSNQIRIETTSQVPIKYDLATFILAEQYSNNDNYTDPICGLPEIPVGLEARVINDQINYLFTCAKDFQRVDNYGGQFLTIQCGYDNRWHGQLPICLPTRQCQKFSLENDETHTYLIEIYKYDRVFFRNETDWIPVRGSRAFFRCKDETNIFVGKEIRICDDGEWTGSLPNCLPTSSVKSEDSLKTSTIMMIVLSTLIFTFLMSCGMIYFFMKIRNQQPADQRQQMGHNGTGGIMLPGMELSDSGAYYSTAIGKQIDDEQYESIDFSDDNRYTPYNDLHNEQQQQQQLPISNEEQAISDYYERMNTNISTNVQPSSPIIISDSYYDDSNVRPSYLAMR
ncbi:uncharacterized protein LOC113797336 isoform X2 [Dermatophagoides pteronyssinus]|uniref:uncharacterized protein LOC113797336 isoform X2 n=1 Tax=Dermatophagoides pteronyssinus TaxID=6956 RepID=UPI003F679F9A